jgi:hypothetical protein
VRSANAGLCLLRTIFRSALTVRARRNVLDLTPLLPTSHLSAGRTANLSSEGVPNDFALCNVLRSSRSDFGYTQGTDDALTDYIIDIQQFIFALLSR